MIEPGDTTPDLGDAARYTAGMLDDDPPSPAPRWMCDTCDQLITTAGVALCWDADVATAEQAFKEWDAARDPSGVVDWGHIIGSMPRPAFWRAFHDGCVPEPEASAYDIEIGLIDTWPKVIGWWRHLSRKSWLPYTNWPDFVFEAATASIPAVKGTHR